MTAEKPTVESTGSSGDGGAPGGVADVAIIGGGVLGAAVATELARRHSGVRLVVFERDALAAGASGRSAGLHLPRGTTPRLQRLTRLSGQTWSEWARADPQLAIRPLAMRVQTRLPGRTLNSRYLTEANLSAVASGDESADTGRRTTWSVEGAHVADVAAVTRRLMSRLPDSARVREAVRIVELDETRHGVQLTTSTGEHVMADRVVLVPGPWLAETAWAALLAPLRLRVKKVAALHIRRPVRADDPVLVFEDDDAFLLPLLERSHWLFSWTCGTWGVRPADLARDLSGQVLVEARSVLEKWSAGMVHDVVGGRVFCDVYAPDREPVVRRVGRTGRIVFAGAANGSGYRLAPGMAREAVDLLSEPPLVPATPPKRVLRHATS